MFEDIRQHLSEIPEGEAIEESMEDQLTGSWLERFALLRQLTPSQRLILLGLLLVDLFLLGFFVLLITGVIRMG